MFGKQDTITEFGSRPLSYVICALSVSYVSSAHEYIEPMSISEIACYPAGLLVQAFCHGGAVVDLPLLPGSLHVERYWRWTFMYISAVTKTDVRCFDCKTKYTITEFEPGSR